MHPVASKLGIPKAYESYEELLNDSDIEAVYIPLPNHLHKEWVFKAAKQGKHILCEKPVALTAQEAEEMVEVCRESNVKVYGSLHVPATSTASARKRNNSIG